MPALFRQDEGLCLDCHRDMKETAADSKLLDIEGGFADEHPEFRATFVTHVGGKDRSERIEIDRREAPKERSNLFFPHKSHLDKTGISPLSSTAIRIPAAIVSSCTKVLHHTSPSNVWCMPR